MRRKYLRACLVCGKQIVGTGDHLYCTDCAKKKRAESVIKPRTCQDCGIEFFGGPRSKRCPSCASYAKAHYKRKPTSRPLGSIDTCSLCGAEYTVASGRQRYCSDKCARQGLLAFQKERKSGYNQNSGQLNKKKERRTASKRICVYCLREFTSSTSTNVCSDYCRLEQKRLMECYRDLSKGENRNIEKYEEKRNIYRNKVEHEMKYNDEVGDAT